MLESPLYHPHCEETRRTTRDHDTKATVEADWSIPGPIHQTGGEVHRDASVRIPHRGQRAGERSRGTALDRGGRAAPQLGRWVPPLGGAAAATTGRLPRL